MQKTRTECRATLGTEASSGKGAWQPEAPRHCWPREIHHLD